MDVRGAGVTEGSCMFFIYVAQNTPDRSDWKSGKWSEIGKKSGKSQGIL